VAPEDGPPALDLDRERRLQAFVREAATRGLLASAQDVSGGGFAVALAECAMWSGLGAHVRLPVDSSPAVDLFGESPSRLIVTSDARHAAATELLARQHGLPVERLGTVGGQRLLIELAGAGATGAAEERGSRVADSIDVALADLERAWEHGLPRALGWSDLEQMGVR
jgi:phosphoribosylformylglycinamidine synthase